MSKNYQRQGIELERRSDVEIAAIFNAEISRALSYEKKGEESAEKIISMDRRHGRVVRQVLEEQLRLNAAKLIDHTLEKSSLLALAIGQAYLPYGEPHSAVIPKQDINESSKSSVPQDVILKKLDEIVRSLGPSVRAQSRTAKAKSRFPSKRDTILFAAIVRDLEGLRYCILLDKHRVKPKWCEDGPKSYRESYLAGGSFPKKVQDDFFQAEDGIRDLTVTGVRALPI